MNGCTGFSGATAHDSLSRGDVVSVLRVCWISGGRFKRVPCQKKKNLRRNVTARNTSKCMKTAWICVCVCGSLVCEESD